MDLPRRRSRKAPPRRALRVATGTVLALGEAIVLAVVAATLYSAYAGFDIPVTTLEGTLATLSFVTVGGFLVAKAPDNVVGWLLWASGLLLAISFGAGYLASEGLAIRPGSVGGAIWFAWLANWVGAPGLLLGAGILPIYFPTGRPLAGRWRAVAILGLVTIGVGVLASVFGHFKPALYPEGIDNPLALRGTAGSLLEIVGNAVYLIFAVVVFPLAVWSLVVRYRRSTEMERRQLKPFALLSGVIVTALLLAFIVGGVVFWFISVGGLGFLPLTIGVAVLRYRLYDIDRIISRTVTYGAVTAILALVFVGTILVSQTFLASFFSGNSIAVAASTLVVAALFQPLRRRVQGVVDRRFNRSHYDAERMVAAFAGRLRDEVALADVDTAIRTTVAQTVAPTAIGLWIRQP